MPDLDFANASVMSNYFSVFVEIIKISYIEIIICFVIVIFLYRLIKNLSFSVRVNKFIKNNINRYTITTEDRNDRIFNRIIESAVNRFLLKYPKSNRIKVKKKIANEINTIFGKPLKNKLSSFTKVVHVFSIFIISGVLLILLLIINDKKEDTIATMSDSKELTVAAEKKELDNEEENTSQVEKIALYDDYEINNDSEELESIPVDNLEELILEEQSQLRNHVIYIQDKSISLEELMEIMLDKPVWDTVSITDEMGENERTIIQVKGDYNHYFLPIAFGFMDTESIKNNMILSPEQTVTEVFKNSTIEISFDNKNSEGTYDLIFVSVYINNVPAFSGEFTSWAFIKLMAAAALYPNDINMIIEAM